MGESGFVACENVFSFKCSGEVVNLLHVAERYGVLMEKAGARIETICRRCTELSRMGKRDEGSAKTHRKRQWELEEVDIRAIA